MGSQQRIQMGGTGGTPRRSHPPCVHPSSRSAAMPRRLAAAVGLPSARSGKPAASRPNKSCLRLIPPRPSGAQTSWPTSEVLPNIRVAILAQALVIETVAAGGEQQARSVKRAEGSSCPPAAMPASYGRKPRSEAVRRPACWWGNRMSRCLGWLLRPAQQTLRHCRWSHTLAAWHSHLCDLPALVVAAQNGYSLRVPHLERHQQSHGLHCRACWEQLAQHYSAWRCTEQRHRRCHRATCK